MNYGYESFGPPPSHHDFSPQVHEQHIYLPSHHEDDEEDYHHVYHGKSKGHDLSIKDFFEIALTALAFLAFGLFVIQLLMNITVSTTHDFLEFSVIFGFFFLERDDGYDDACRHRSKVPKKRQGYPDSGQQRQRGVERAGPASAEVDRGRNGRPGGSRKLSQAGLVRGQPSLQGHHGWKEDMDTRLEVLNFFLLMFQKT